jgi:hypothetical protein
VKGLLPNSFYAAPTERLSQVNSDIAKSILTFLTGRAIYILEILSLKLTAFYGGNTLASIDRRYRSKISYYPHDICPSDSHMAQKNINMAALDKVLEFFKEFELL